MTFVGIDVSATRGFDLCAIDERRRVTVLAKVRDLEALEPLLRQFPKDTTFAVDASATPSLGLVPGRDHRVVEHDLRKLGITLYFTPRTEEAAPAWMREGFALYRLLDGMGFPVFHAGDAGSGLTIEVYPHLSYVSLSGTRRGSASKLEWTRAVLRGKVGGLPPNADQDALDAACCALTAWNFVQGRWVAYGDPTEGVIVAPQPKTELGRAEAIAADQLALPIDAGAPPRAIRPARASTFAERITAIVAQIPAGRVATFGDVARWAGKPAGARAVGTVLKAHAFELPCHRVVTALGEPPPYPENSAERLASEGIALVNGRVDLPVHRWRGPA
jgi:methylated-DNA-[protein]-cysteine S-methyltransferase/methylated-DNA-protein-cysteine methyltransferase-like protein